MGDAHLCRGWLGMAVRCWLFKGHGEGCDGNWNFGAWIEKSSRFGGMWSTVVGAKCCQWCCEPHAVVENQMWGQFLCIFRYVVIKILSFQMCNDMRQKWYNSRLGGIQRDGIQTGEKSGEEEGPIFCMVLCCFFCGEREIWVLGSFWFFGICEKKCYRMPFQIHIAHSLILMSPFLQHWTIRQFGAQTFCVRKCTKCAKLAIHAVRG